MTNSSNHFHLDMALLRTRPISSCVSGEEKEESPESVIIRFRLQRGA